MNENRRQKWGLHICIFVSIMALTFWSVFRNQDFMEMTASIQRMSMQSMAAAAVLAVLFVAGEGCMIWYLLKGITEAMYRAVFEEVFPADCLVASLCITRGISFYLVMAVSFTVWLLMCRE